MPPISFGGNNQHYFTISSLSKVFVGVLQEQRLQLAQSHPHPVLPFFLLRIITKIAALTAIPIMENTITSIIILLVSFYRMLFVP